MLMYETGKNSSIQCLRFGTAFTAFRYPGGPRAHRRPTPGRCFRVWPYANRNRARFVASTCAHRPGGGAGEKHGQCGRSSRATEVSGTRPAGRMRRRRRRGSGAPRRLTRRTGKPERGSEEARPAPTTGPHRQAREPAPRTDRQAGEQHRLAGPERRHGRSDRGGGGATAGEANQRRKQAAIKRDKPRDCTGSAGGSAELPK